MLSTAFTELIGCEVPVQMAAMGGLAAPELVAAVSEAGGLGMFGAAGMSAARLEGLLDAADRLTSRPYGVNFQIPFLTERDVVALAANRVRLVEFFFGEPDRELVEMVHAGGALAGWQIGSRREAVAAAEAGCNLIVAQGIEAGGHVRGEIGLLPLLSEVLDAVEVPVLAAGGIGTGRAMAACLAAGAAGVRIGTRFIAASESNAHPAYVAALIAADTGDTIYTEAFSGGWIGRGPHRVLRSALTNAEAFPDEIVGARPSPATGETAPVKRFDSGTPTAATTGAIEAMSLWAGESVGAVRSVQPAAEIVRELCDGAERLLSRWR